MPLKRWSVLLISGRTAEELLQKLVVSQFRGEQSDGRTGVCGKLLLPTVPENYWPQNVTVIAPAAVMRGSHAHD